MTHLRTLLTGGIFFEGPRWRDDSWWVSDFYDHTVSRITPHGRRETVVEVEAQQSGLGWLPDGSLVISSMLDQRILRFAPARSTTLKRVSGGGRGTVVAHGLQFPNGSVVTPDGTTLIVGETFGNRYTAWDLSPEGELSNRRVWARFGPGAIVDELRAPEGFGVFACALGGASGRTLLLCAVPPVASLDSQGPRDAVLFTVDVAVPAAH